MTTEQIDRDFDVVWTGRDYLCVRTPPSPRPDLLRALPPLTPEDIQDRQGRNRQLVIHAMPGTAVALETNSGLTARAVLAVLNNLRRTGKLLTTKERGQLTVYGVRTDF